MLSSRYWALFGATVLVSAIASCGDDDAVPPTTPPTTGGAGGEGGTGGVGGDAGIQIPGLSGPVDAVYDEHGLLHLSCATDDDCFAALGYFHAQNRFFFMDFVRNLVRGKLAKLVSAGELVLDQDYENRRFFSTREGEPLEDKLYADASDQVRGHLDAYTNGVNAWIGDMRNKANGATLTTEYDFTLVVKANIRDWEPQDSAAVGLYVLNDLSNNSGSEIVLGEQIPAFDPILGADLFSPEPVFDAFTMTSGTPTVNGPPSGVAGSALDPSVSARLAPLGGLLSDAAQRMRRVGSGNSVSRFGEIGSNNWAVGPARTADGNAILANDPHLVLTNPSIWFGVELDAKTHGEGAYHVAGSTFPGLPSVMVGHNEDIGWGVTTAYYDLADVYVETLTPDGSAVEFDGGEVAIIEKEFEFEDAATGDTLTQTFRWVPHHGPIISEDEEAGTAITIKWTGHAGGTDLDAFFGLARATDVVEARTAIESASSANQNFVVVDKDGDFGWFPYASVPVRAWASPATPPWVPLPGDGSFEWDGAVPYASLPQLFNPDSGEIATANQDSTGASADGDITNDGQDAMQAWAKAEGARQQRILDLLAEGGNDHSVATLTAMQGDTYSLYGEFTVPLVITAASAVTLDPEAQAVVDALSAWAFTCPTGLEGSDPRRSAKSTDPTATAESIGCTAFHATYYAIVEEALGDEQAQAGAEIDLDGTRADFHLVARALRDPGSLSSGALLWDDVTSVGTTETRDDILVRALIRAGAALAALGPVDDWRWGRVHTLSLRSIYDNFGVDDYNEGPYAAPGGQYTVNVANPVTREVPDEGDAPDFAFAAGPSVRFVVEATPDGPRMTYQLPGGNDLHRESDFYNNLLPNWLVNEAIAFPFGEGAVPDPAVSLVVTAAP